MKTTKYILILLALMALSLGAWAQQGLQGLGTSTNPYLITSDDDWETFAQSVTDGTTYANQFVKLTADITVTTMAGIENKCFSGTFDGFGHTITLNMTATTQFTALFCYADGATFQNLKVDGTLNTSKKFCAGLVGAVVYHGCTFTNCVSDVTINSTVEGDGSHGGFVSFIWDANAFDGCAFTGKLLGPSTSYVGGFVGFTETNQNGSVTFNNCLFIPEEVTMGSSESQTFARWRSGDNAVTIGANCYYSQTLGAAQGKLIHSIRGTKTANVAFSGNAITNYTVSGINAYSVGMKYAGTCYAGETEVVSLNLTHGNHPCYTYGDGYIASAGNLTQINSTDFSLSMPNQNVRIEPVITVCESCIPLTLEATENGTTVTIKNPLELTIQYSTDDGDTWISSNVNPITIGINAGQKASLRGDNASYADPWYQNITSISCDLNCYVYGNVMSLVSSDGFATATALTGSFNFTGLFIKKADEGLGQANTTIQNHPTKDIILPATTLTDHCYTYMFYNCQGLTRAPALPATTLQESCYENMFMGCSGLTSAPLLPATTLANNCYHCMFSSCSSLTTAPELPATTLANYCYYSMFNLCSSLTTAPELPATTLKNSCYRDMFLGCTSLTTAPELPAMVLAEGC